MTDVAIVAAAGTPVGSFKPALASDDAHEPGSVAIPGALKRSGAEPGEVDEVVTGQILQAGEGKIPAWQASIGAGIPVKSPAWSLVTAEVNP